jgi:Neuraminidase (sialidase)
MAVATNTRAAKRDATTAYVALNYTDGIRIYKTNNCGATWSMVSIQNSLYGYTPDSLFIIPSNPDIVLLMAEDNSNSYIFKSVDGGLTFTSKLQIVRNTTGQCRGNFLRFGSGRILAFVPTIWGGINQSNFYGYTSDDNGDTWTMRVDAMYTTGYPFGSRMSSLVEYAAGATCIAGADLEPPPSYVNLWLLKTTDWGIHWSKTLFYDSGVQGCNTAVTQLLNGDIAVSWSATTSNQPCLYISKDLGTTWTRKTPNMPKIDNMTSTKNRLIFYSSGDGKIYISDDEGDTVTPVATGIEVVNSFLLF